MNIKTIIEAWIIAKNPTDKQIELAENRLSICDTCEHKNVINKKIKILTICSECGCPLAKKAFSNVYNECKLGKWESVDDKYFDNQKKNKTLL